MYSDNRNGSRAAPARGFVALGAMLAMGLGLMASPAAAPFAYVTNGGDARFNSTVSEIDTATNTVVATVGVGSNPFGVAVAPDGKRAYVTNANAPGTVSVIDTASNTVVATVPVGDGPKGVAITPDGKHAYVTNTNIGTVSVIDTASNMVVATVAVGKGPRGVAVTPDGKHAYVANFEVLASGDVSVIDTATNTVVGDVSLGDPEGVTENACFQA
jgi:YVTN family beta-propeller protein